MTILESADSLDGGGDTHDCGHDHGTGQQNVDHMKYERYRLGSFDRWPQSANVDKNQLAANGFYYIGDGTDDRVQCDFCKIILKKWEPGDDIQEEHRKHGPQCPYVNDPTHSGNFPLPFRRLDSINRHHHGPCHREYREREVRFQSFYNWPHPDKRPTPGELADAGFFYLGQGDAVKCFYCGGMLRHWEEKDEVWTEHMKWFPLCLFVVEHDPSCHGDIGRHLRRTISGIALSNGYSDDEINGYRQYIDDNEITHPEEYREFVNQLDQFRQRQAPISAPSVASSAAETSNEVNPQHAAGRTDVEDQNERYLCKVCYKNTLEVIFYPCKHVCCCKECGDKLSNCPVCREVIRGKLQLFFP
ncbi:BIRC7_8 [Mytilus edulis]|uniref:BIRC7_8 n=2 Tax=Mytilus edulis TaxID=6550 RepID=A0A8S3VMX7_MYTED|nr:BIRC7_8 [Mytilus edulis]